MTIGEGIREALCASDNEAAWSAPPRVDLARTYGCRARALGPARGGDDLAAMREIADGLLALARVRSAGEVQGFIEWVEGHWARGSG